MYQKFNATTIDIDRIRKVIHIDFNFDVNEDTINGKTIYVYKNKTGDVVNTQYSVDGMSANLSFTGDMEPNIEYVLVVSKEVSSITGEGLYTAVKKIFSIESSVDSTVVVTSPSNYEELKDKISLVWKEVAGDSKTLHGNFLIQIASDNLFFNNLISSTVSEKSQITFGTIKDAVQYFVRIRAQESESDFGPWSDVMTFTLSKTKPTQNDDELIFQQDMEILTVPENGETPESFIIEFDSEINVNSIEDNIILIRKPV